MLYRHQYKDLVWIDSELATEEEVRELVQEFDLEPTLAQELLVHDIKPVLQTFSDHFYIALHFPALKHSHTDSRKQEIDLVVGRDVVITNRYDTMDAIHKFSKSFEVEAVTNPQESGIDNAAVVLFGILQKLYHSVVHELEHQSGELIEIEEAILGGQEREMVVRLSKESMNLLAIEQVLSGHKEVLNDLEREVVRFFGDDMAPYAQAIQDEYERVMEKAKLNRGLLNELRRTNDGLLQTKQNEISKNLTIIATITLPPILIAEVLGTNLSDMPLIDHPHGFTIVLVFMLLTSALAYMLLKLKRWF